jgi:hypothetical protein
MNSLTVRLSQYAVQTAIAHSDSIRTLVRIKSPALTTSCRQAGLPLEMAEICGGLLATMTDDLIEASRLPKSDISRTKRMQRILQAAEEPQACALKLAMAASPLNGRTAVAHWDAICDKHEVGRLAWLLGMDTGAAHRYARKREQREKRGHDRTN